MTARPAEPLRFPLPISNTTGCDRLQRASSHSRHASPTQDAGGLVLISTKNFSRAAQPTSAAVEDAIL